MDTLPSAQRLLRAKAKRVQRRLNARRKVRRVREDRGWTEKHCRTVANRIVRRHVKVHLRLFQEEPTYRHLSSENIDVEWNYH